MCEKMYSAMEISELRMLSKENCGDYVFRYVEKYVVGSTCVTFCQKFSLIFIVDFRFYIGINKTLRKIGQKTNARKKYQQ